ncbi:MAG TPA: sialidase family protein [Ktedonobacterales bacterium]|nr:sialidase family protein [Ktedonobacterales bacterium]
MDQQLSPVPRKPRGLLWLGIVALALLTLFIGLAVPALPALLLAPKTTTSPTTTAARGPWYLAGGGSCVQLPSSLPKQISNVQVSHDSFLAHSEPEIAENPLNPLNLVGGSKFFTDPAHYRFKIGYYTSMDGGCTWTDGGIFPGYGAYTLTSDISFAFGRHNDVYGAVLVDGSASNGQFSGVAVSRSTDGGRTFQAPVLLQADSTGATFSDKPWIGVDNTGGPFSGSIYVVWNLDSNRMNSAPIYFSRSTDGGRTFSKGVEIDGVSPHCQFGNPEGNSGARTCDSALGATPVIGPDGAISVVYAYLDPRLADDGDNGQDQGSTQQPGGPAIAGSQPHLAQCAALPPSQAAHTQMMVVQSRDGGQTWANPIDAAEVYDVPFHFRNSCFRNFSLPAFAVDSTNGTLYISWSDERNGDADIVLVRSTDGGQTWSAPVRVNDDPVGDGKDQFQPQVAVAPDDVVSVMFFDRRNDPNNLLVDVYLAQSTDGGQTFHPNVRVTSVASDPSVDAPVPDDGTNVTFFGDYQGLAVDDHFAHVFWNDTRTGSQQIFTAAMPSVQQ